MTSDDTFSTTSTADTDVHTLAFQTCWPPPQKTIAAVWTEVDLDIEWQRSEDHRKWWNAVVSQSAADTKPKATVAPGTGTDVKDSEGRRNSIAAYERSAALFRELAASNEALHPILGYGTEGRRLVIVHQASTCAGLRSFQFTQPRCYRFLGQSLKAFAALHEQQLAHGHVSPECFLIDEEPLGPQVRICWLPGQKRTEGRCSATLGFRGPGDPTSPPGDIWALACVVLVWWMGFSPAPHPWTQFRKHQSLLQEMQKAISEQPPAMPKALLDLHLASAVAEEPEHSFLALLASLLTRCLAFDPAERPSATQLLKHPFFGELSL